jgi:hypothetical protein
LPSGGSLLRAHFHGERISRKHYDLSEWKPGFRADVNAAWLASFRDYERYVEEHVASLASKDSRLAVLIAFKAQVADRFKITYDELNDILEATD